MNNFREYNRNRRLGRFNLNLDNHSSSRQHHAWAVVDAREISNGTGSRHRGEICSSFQKARPVR